MTLAREIMLGVGWLSGVAGIACYDWRAAIVAGGISLCAAAIWGMCKDAN